LKHWNAYPIQRNTRTFARDLALDLETRITDPNLEDVDSAFVTEVARSTIGHVLHTFSTNITAPMRLNIFEADLTDLSHLGMQQPFFLKETNHAIIVRKTHICDDTNLTIMTP
jgi:hypothetical protein